MAISGSGRMCYGALITSAVFILQASSLFFPVFGTLLSVAGTILVAVAAILLKRHAVIVYLSAVLLIAAVSPRYAAEFLMTTGFVGLTIGLCFYKNPVLALCISSIGMFSGLCCVMYLLGTAAFGSLFADLPIGACLPVFAVFSAAYCILCFYILRKFTKKALLSHH